MMSKHIAIVTILALGCGPRTEPASCDTDRMAVWILECIEKGNPHSDEEPEDATRQCEATAIHLFCGTQCTKNEMGRIRCDRAMR